MSGEAGIAKADEQAGWRGMVKRVREMIKDESKLKN